MSDPRIQVLSSGGNACVLLVTKNSTKTVVRVSHATDASESQAKMQHKLWTHFKPFVLDIRSYTTVPVIPEKYRVVMNAHAKCRAMMDLWRLESIGEYAITKTEYAPLGSLAAYGKNQDPEVIRVTCFYVLSFLYLSEAMFGFTHNDLTAANIVLSAIGQNVVAHVIDFDFSAFHSQTLVSVAMGSVGVRYTLPPEVLRNQYKASYIGAVDVWALGVTMLGCLVGNASFLNDKTDAKIVARIECLQCYLQKTKVPIALQEAHADMQRYEAKIHAMDEVTLEFYKCVLDKDPLARIQGGNLYELLKLSLYFEPIPRKDDILKILVKDRLPNRKYVNTLSTAKAQLERAVAAKLIAGKTVACVQCKQTTWPLYICAQYGFVVCGEDCQLKHRQRV